MRILRIITSMNPAMGGPPQGVRTSIAAMKRLDTDCVNEVVCFDDANESFLVGDDFVTHALGRGSGPWQRSAAFVPWLVANLPRFDAVIVHGLWQYPSYATCKVVRKLRKESTEALRLFVMPHGMLDPWFQKAPSRRIKAIRNWFYWKLIEERVIATADGLLFTCQKELELARTTFQPYRPKRELNVGYGVTQPPTDDERLRRAFREQVAGLGERPYLLFVGRIHPKKGVDLLIDAYVDQLTERLAAGLTTTDLVIAGPLDLPYAQEMQRKAAGRMAQVPSQKADEARPTIHFPGMLTGDTKWGAFYGCEALILPSHQENFGIAVVEALACSRPVLISDQVNIYDEIELAKAGFVDRDDAAGTERLFRKFLSLDKAERARMSAAASRCYANCFYPESAASRLLEAISLCDDGLASTTDTHKGFA